MPFYVEALQKINIKLIKIKLMNSKEDKHVVLNKELQNVFKLMLEGKSAGTLKKTEKLEKK